MRLGTFLLLVVCLMPVSGCISGDDGMPPPGSAPFEVNLAAELALLNLHAYQQLADYLDDQTLTLPDPYRLHAVLLTSEFFAGERFNFNEDVPIGFVASAGNAIYVVFRGTQTISEWISNATFPQVIYDFVNDFGKTHRGFTAVYESVHEALLTAVNELIDTGDVSTLYVTGHSLGGALAVLATPELWARTPLEPIMYNFAAPRVGDAWFRQRYNELIRNSWRTVNRHDLVPDLPPVTVISFDVFPPEEVSYTHVFSENEITFGDSIDNPLDVLNIGSNHDMCNYYNAICDRTDDPASCKALAGGADGCNP
jgi:triacylglycerol lipase